MLQVKGYLFDPSFQELENESWDLELGFWPELRSHPAHVSLNFKATLWNITGIIFAMSQEKLNICKSKNR